MKYNLSILLTLILISYPLRAMDPSLKDPLIESRIDPEAQQSINLEEQRLITFNSSQDAPSSHSSISLLNPKNWVRKRKVPKPLLTQELDEENSESLTSITPLASNQDTTGQFDHLLEETVGEEIIKQRILEIRQNIENAPQLLKEPLDKQKIIEELRSLYPQLCNWKTLQNQPIQPPRFNFLKNLSLPFLQALTAIKLETENLHESIFWKMDLLIPLNNLLLYVLTRENATTITSGDSSLLELITPVEKCIKKKSYKALMTHYQKRLDSEEQNLKDEIFRKQREFDAAKKKHDDIVREEERWRNLSKCQKCMERGPQCVGKSCVCLTVATFWGLVGWGFVLMIMDWAS
jgi:hypothetical protein